MATWSPSGPLQAQRARAPHQEGPVSTGERAPVDHTWIRRMGGGWPQPDRGRLDPAVRATIHIALPMRIVRLPRYWHCPHSAGDSPTHGNGPDAGASFEPWHLCGSTSTAIPEIVLYPDGRSVPGGLAGALNRRVIEIHDAILRLRPTVSSILQEGAMKDLPTSTHPSDVAAAVAAAAIAAALTGAGHRAVSAGTPMVLPIGSQNVDRAAEQLVAVATGYARHPRSREAK